MPSRALRVGGELEVKFDPNRRRRLLILPEASGSTTASSS
jgi:hypothetical protein